MYRQNYRRNTSLPAALISIGNWVGKPPQIPFAWTTVRRPILNTLAKNIWKMMSRMYCERFWSSDRSKLLCVGTKNNLSRLLLFLQRGRPILTYIRTRAGFYYSVSRDALQFEAESWYYQKPRRLYFFLFLFFYSSARGRNVLKLTK